VKEGISNSLTYLRTYLLTPWSRVFLEIHLNFTLPSPFGSLKRSLSLSFPHQNPVDSSRLLNTYYTCPPPPPSNSSQFDHPNNWWKNSSLCGCLQSLVTSSLLGPNIINTLFSNTFRYVPPSISATKFHTHSNNRKNAGSVHLIFLFLDSKLEDQKILHGMVASIPLLQSAPDFFLKIILIF